MKQTGKGPEEMTDQDALRQDLLDLERRGWDALCERCHTKTAASGGGMAGLRFDATDPGAVRLHVYSLEQSRCFRKSGGHYHHRSHGTSRMPHTMTVDESSHRLAQYQGSIDKCPPTAFRSVQSM